MQRHLILFSAFLFLTAACDFEDATPDFGEDAGAGRDLVSETAGDEDAVAGGDAVDCACDADNECCDGCDAIATAEGSACDTGVEDLWGICRAGSCVSVGTVTGFAGLRDDADPVDLATNDGLFAIADSAGPDATEGAALLWGDDGTVLYEDDVPSLGVAFSPDGAWLAIGQADSVVVRAVADASEVQTLDAAYGPVAFSPDGAWLAAGTEGGVGVWETATWTLAQDLSLPEDDRAWLWRVRFSPDGTILAAGRGQAALLGSPHGELTLWDLPDFTERAEFDCTAWDLAFSPDSSQLAAACWNYARLWDLADDSLVTEVSIYTSATAVAWSPAGDEIALGTFSGGLFLYPPSDLGGAHTAALPAQIVRAVHYLSESTLGIASWSEPFAAVWDRSAL